MNTHILLTKALVDLALACIEYAGPLDDPQIGWTQHNSENPEAFKCERCHREHTDSRLIDHSENCRALALIKAFNVVRALSKE